MKEIMIHPRSNPILIVSLDNAPMQPEFQVGLLQLHYSKIKNKSVYTYTLKEIIFRHTSFELL